MDTYTIKSDKEKFYAKNNNSSLGSIFGSFGYKKTKRKESLTIKDLYEILTDQNNKSLQKELKITNSKKQNVSFKNDENNKNFFLLETDNKTEVFRKSDFKKVKEEIKEGASRTVKIFYNNIEKIKRFDSNNEKLSEEIINREDNTRKRIEFREDSKIIEQFNSDNKRISEEIINIKDNNRKYTEFFKDNIIVRTFTNNFEKIEQFDLNNKKLFEETINLKDNTREFIEYHKNDSIKNKLTRTIVNGEQDYTLETYDKIGKYKIVKPSWKNSEDFETVKNNNILGHKPKFVLDELYWIEKDLRNINLVTNRNNILPFSESFEVILNDKEIEDALCKKFNYSDYDELCNICKNNSEFQEKVDNFRLSFSLAKRVEFLKDNFSSIELMYKNIQSYILGAKKIYMQVSQHIQLEPKKRRENLK